MPPRAEDSQNGLPDANASDNGNSNAVDDGILAWAARMLTGTEVDFLSIADSEMPVFVENNGGGAPENGEVDLTPPPGYALLQDDAGDASDDNPDDEDGNNAIDQAYRAHSEEFAAEIPEEFGTNEENLSEEEHYRREVQAAALRLAKAAEEQDGDTDSDTFSDNADFGEFETADELNSKASERPSPTKAWNREKLSPEVVAKVKDAMAGVKLDNVPAWARSLTLARSDDNVQMSQSQKAH